VLGVRFDQMFRSPKEGLQLVVDDGFGDQDQAAERVEVVYPSRRHLP
jgi:hypothetical protein